MLSFKKIAEFLKRVGNSGATDNSNAASPRAGGTTTGSTSTSNISNNIMNNNNNSNAGGLAAGSSGVLQGLPATATTQEVLLHLKQLVEARQQANNTLLVGTGGGGKNTDEEEDCMSSHMPPVWNDQTLAPPIPPNTNNNNNNEDGGNEANDDSLILLSKQLSGFDPKTGPLSQNINTANSTPLNKSLTRDLPSSHFGGYNTNNNNNNNNTINLDPTSNMMSIGYGVWHASEYAGANDSLPPLLAERAEMVEMLDVCLQEIPAEEEDTTTTTAAVAAADTKKETNSNDNHHARKSLASSPIPAAGEAGDGAAPVTTVTDVTSNTAPSVAVTVATPTPSSPSFDVYAWRQLLLSILHLLVTIERAIYIERSRVAMQARHELEMYLDDLKRKEEGMGGTLNNTNTSSSHNNTTTTLKGEESEAANKSTSAINFPMPDGATSLSELIKSNNNNTSGKNLLNPEANANASTSILTNAHPVSTNHPTAAEEAPVKGVNVKKQKEKELLQAVEETLNAALSTATWVMLRNVINQHIKKIENTRYRNRVIAGSTAHKSPSPDGDLVAMDHKASGFNATKKAWKQDEVIMIDWKVVVSEVKELLDFKEDNISQCIICAALIRDDGRELLSCMLQQPKPKYVLRALTKKRDRVGSTVASATAPANTNNPSSTAVKTCVSNRLATSTSSSSSGGNTSGSSSTTNSGTNSPKTVSSAAAGNPPHLTLTGTPGSNPISATATPTIKTTASPAPNIEDDVVLDDLLEHLEFIYTEGVSKTFQSYLEETLFSLDQLDDDDESINNATADNPSAVFSYNSFIREEDDVVSNTDRSSSHCSPSRWSRREQEGRASTGAVKPPERVGASLATATTAEEEKRPLPSIIMQLNDPRMFCQLATAFFFCSDSWSSRSRMNLFQSLSDGIGAHMIKDTTVDGKRIPTAPVSRAATPANVPTGPSSPALAVKLPLSGGPSPAPTPTAPLPPSTQKTPSNPTTITVTNVTSQPLASWRAPNNTYSRSNTPINSTGNSNPTAAALGTPIDTDKFLHSSHSTLSSTARQESTILNSAMVAAMYRDTFFNRNQWQKEDDDDVEDDVADTIASLPVLLRDMLERIVNMSWSAALHKHVQHCIKARPPLLSEAEEFAKQERKAALFYNDFRAKQRALGSLVSAQLASGKSHEAFVVAKKHFNNEKKEWASKGQSMFSALQYLQSMKMLVQTQAASRNYGAVVETVQFVLPQAALCDQMLEVLCPKPRGDFIVRFGECRAKLLQTRVYLYKECWRAYYATDQDRAKTEKYFREHIYYLGLVRRFQRETELYDAYMERGSQLLFRGLYEDAVALFQKAVEISKAALAAADAKYNRGTTTSTSLAPSTAGSPSITSNLFREGSTYTTNSSFIQTHLRGAGSGSLTSAEEHFDNNIHHNREKLELPWRLAESQRMLALAYVTQAEHEVNVPKRRAQLSNAVSDAYASQSSLRRWQSKGGTPKRMLTAVPCSLYVNCKALLLLKQARKAVLLLEPLIERKGSNQTRPDGWHEIFLPTEDPLTAEDIVLRVNVSIVKIAIFQLYAKCISCYDGEKALAVLKDHVERLLEEETEWIKAVEKDVMEQPPRASQPSIALDKEAMQQLSNLQQQQQQQQERHSSKTNSVVDEAIALSSASGVLTPSIRTAEVKGGRPSGSEANLPLPIDPTPTTARPNANSETKPPSSIMSHDGEGSPAATEVTSNLSANPVAVLQEAVSPQEVTPADAVHNLPSNRPVLEPIENTIRVVIESRSERQTALNALYFAKKEVRKAHRDLFITKGDAYCLLQRLNDALESYSAALLINEDDSISPSEDIPKEPVTSRAVGLANSVPVVESASHDDEETVNAIAASDVLAVVAHDDRTDTKVHENTILSKLADVYKALQKPSMAIHYNELVVAYSRESKDALLEYNSLLQLARIYTQWNMQPSEAQDLWEKVSALARDYNDDEVGRETMRNIINGQEAAGSYMDVVATAQELMKLTDNLDGSEGTMDRRFALEALARAHLHLAQYDKCLEALDLREKEQEKTNEWSGQILEMRAKALLGIGEKEKAIVVLQSWVNKAHSLGLWRELGSAHKALAIAHAGANEMYEARDHHTAALTAFERVLVLHQDCRISLLDSARWLVHYYNLSEEPITVNKAIKLAVPEVSNQSMTDNLQSFDHNLHNNSGDLGVILEEDQKMRASQEDDDDLFGGEEFSFGGSFVGGADALLNDDTPFDGLSNNGGLHDGPLTDNDSTTTASTQDKEKSSEDPFANKEEGGEQEEGEKKEDDGVLVAYEEVKPKPKLFLDSFDKAHLTSEKDLLPLLINATKKGPNDKAAPKPTPAPKANLGPAPPSVKGMQLPSTTIANVSLCNRPAAPSDGRDVLDEVVSETDSTDAVVIEARDAFTDKPPSKVYTTCFRDALVYMEWAHHLVQSFNALSRYVNIPYSPAEAVDLALLAHRDCTFVFYFAEYTTPSSSCYDVVVRPAGYDYFWSQRSAQVTTLRQYHQRRLSDYEPKSKPVDKSRNEIAQAVFGGGATTTDTNKKEKEKESAPQPPPVPPLRQLQKDTLQSLYDIYDELWSPVNSAFRQMGHFTLQGGKALFIVPDPTLLHTPFPSLLPNPEMCRPEEDTRPIGAQVPVTVSPSLTHIAMFSTNASCQAAFDEASHTKPFKNIIILPENVSSPHPRVTVASNVSDTTNRSPGIPKIASTTGFISLSSTNSLTGMQRAASGIGELRYALPSTYSNFDGVGSTTSEPDTAGNTKRTPGPPDGNTEEVPPPPTLSAASSVTSAPRPLLRDPFAPLLNFWEIHNGSTRKELMHYFVDETVRGFMILCPPKNNGSSVGDGTVSAYDIINIGNLNYASANSNIVGGGNGGASTHTGATSPSKSSKAKKETAAEFERASFVPCTRRHLELIVLASDRAVQTTSDAIGAAALFCSQLQCKRVLRVDLAPGETLNVHHKEFIVMFLEHLERAKHFGLNLSYSIALQGTLLELYETHGENHMEWAAFTLVGMP